MGFKCGIVGLPNVGKSTIFNALAKAKAEASNYPFCTIDPNKGIVPVPDTRLWTLSDLYHPQKTTPTSVEFYDIAGLVKGASEGEGLGNQFLGHIKEVEAILHVVRCFDDPNIIHVSGNVDPLRDIEVIDTELCLKDIETMTMRFDKTEKLARSGDKESREKMPLYEKVKKSLEDGIPLRRMGLNEEEKKLLKDLPPRANRCHAFRKFRFRLLSRSGFLSRAKSDTNSVVRLQTARLYPPCAQLPLARQSHPLL